MNQQNMKKNSNKFMKMLQIIIVAAFLVVFTRVIWVAGFHRIAGENLKTYVETRNIVEQDVRSKRGTIFDVYGNVIAETLPRYNLIAILDPKYSDNLGEKDRKRHVTNPEEVAEKIAPIIEMPKDEMLDLLKKKDVFQVEFAPYGNKLRQTVKDKIDELNLEGITFTDQDDRLYPQGVFASHTVGYATFDNEANRLNGKMGIEQRLDEYLRGTDGLMVYQETQTGKKIRDLRNEPVENGSNVYLTIDSTIQKILEENMRTVQDKHQPEWAISVVANPKTGAVLGVAQTPTFNPNERNMSNYMNYLAETEYEVGSVMKTFTFATAIDAGVFDADKLVQTGSMEVDGFQINDWWSRGAVDPYPMRAERGLCMSSNTIIASVVDSMITPEQQREYFKKFGFGNPTGLELPAEKSGKFVLKSNAERITSGFGQGSTATVAQMVQGYSAIANNGKMMQLHLIDRVVNPDTGKEVYKYQPEQVGQPISEQSAQYVKKLLVDTVNDPTCSSGSTYKLDDAVFAGKTGTAQVARTDGVGGYLPFSDTNFTYAFAGFAPADNPEFVIYTSVSLPKQNPTGATGTIIKNVTSKINDYLSMRNNNPSNIKQEGAGVQSVKHFPSFLNRSKEEADAWLHTYQVSYVVLGDGARIINQNIEPNSAFTNKERVILLTNGENFVMPNITNWARQDVEILAKMLNISIEVQGSGYVVGQSIPEGTPIVLSPETKINVQLQP